MDEIIYNLKLTTSIKNELLKEVSEIFLYSSERDKKEELTQSIGTTILALLLLSRRYGIDLSTMEKYIDTRIKSGISDNDLCEEKFGDLSYLAKYLRGEQ